MRIALILAVLAGCGRDTAPTITSDGLWALAPAGARGGIVVTAKGVGMLERGYADVQKLVATVPDLAAAQARLTEALAPFGPAITLADFGFTPHKGAALFMRKDGMVAVLPLADRDKFLAKVGGTKGADVDTIDNTTCKMINGYYTCANSPALLADVAKGDLKKHLGPRGEIEIIGAELPFGEPGKPMTVAAAVQLVRGQATLRGSVINAPKELVDRLARTATPKVDAQRTAGFALVDLPAWLPPTEEKLVGDITIGQVLGTLDGLISITTPAGATVLNVEQAVTDPAPLATIIARCNELPGGDVLEAASAEGVCRFKAPNWDVTLDMWMDGKTLRVGQKKAPPPGVSVPLTPIGRELARGPWSFVFWGRGTMLAGPPIPGITEPTDIPAESAMVIRLMSMISELGFGARMQGDKLELVATVRTLFASPDDVIAKVSTITAKDIAATRSRALAEPIARSAPSSPFAHDFTAGHAGLLVPTALAGQGVSMVVTGLMMMRQQELPPTAPQ
jgi:hypothetical protein